MTVRVPSILFQTFMAHATGTRLLAALCCLSIVGLPIGIPLWMHARKKEQEAKRRQEALEAIRDNVD